MVRLYHLIKIKLDKDSILCVMPSKNLFHFRQRAGKLDWKAVSSLSVDNILIKGHIEDLQYILDQVTFSEFSPLDVRNNSIDQVAKLVQVMQLIIEYMLHYQELNFQQIRGLTQKNADLRLSKKKLRSECIKYEDDIKNYQRQLHILKKSLHEAGVGAPTPSTFAPQARVINPKEDQGRTENLVMALMEHEGNARKEMMRLLEEQRKTYTQEMDRIITHLHPSHAPPNPDQSPSPSMLAEISKAWESRLHEVVQALYVQMEESQRRVVGRIDTLLTTQNDNFNNISKNLNSTTATVKAGVGVEVREKALQQLEDALKERERGVSEREQRCQALFNQLQQDFQKRQASLAAGNLGSAWGVVSSGERKRRGARLMVNVLRHVLHYRVQRFFFKWMHHTPPAIPLPHTLLELEREKAKVRELRVEMDKLKRSDGGEDVSKLRVELKAEKERNLILTAQYHTVSRALEKEKEKEKDRLEKESKQPVFRETASVMTSMNYPPVRSSRYADADVNTSMLFPAPAAHQDMGVGGEAAMGTDTYASTPSYLATLEDRYQGGDEDQLLAQAMGRIRNKAQGWERAALVSLAEELSSKLPINNT